MVSYLDFNATAPIEKEVLEYMIEIYEKNFGNPNSRTHIYGNQAKEIVNKSRRIIAECLGIDEMEVIFTSGSTESNNMAILGLFEYAKQTGKNHFITTSIEHKAVLEPMKFLKKNGCEVDFISPGNDGRINAEDVLGRITDKTLLVSVMHVNSETGMIQPIKEIGDFLEKKNILFHVDATQSFGKMNAELKKVKYDLMSVSAHKLRGPQGVGAFIKRIRKPLCDELKPIMYGGGQEYGLRPGTLPVALVGGFGKAVELCEKNKVFREKKCLEIKKQLLKDIDGLDYEINGDPLFCVPNTINLSFKGVDAEGIFVGLKGKYAFSNGAACVSGGYSNSYVLEAMGYDEKRMEEAIRISWDYDTCVDFSGLVNYVREMQE